MELLVKAFSVRKKGKVKKFLAENFIIKMKLINYRNKRYNFQLNGLHHHYWGPPARRYYKVPFYKDYII